MELNQLLELLPINAESLILGLRIAGFAAIPIAIALFARAMTLNNALSAVKAQKMLRVRDEEPAPIVVQKIEEHPPQQEYKPKKPLLVYTISAEAQDLLQKIAVLPTVEDGWNVTPATE